MNTCNLRDCAHYNNGGCKQLCEYNTDYCKKYHRVLGIILLCIILPIIVSGFIVCVIL